MVHHIILWKLKESLTEEEMLQAKKDIKTGLEGLAGKIDGLQSIKVRTESLPSSNADIMLDSTFDSVASLEGYQVHPAHTAVASGVVRPKTEIRLCMDYED